MTRRAFTLVELVVVVGIIVLLVGITVTVGVNVVEKAEMRKTQNVIQMLDTALQEWEVAADRKLSYGQDGAAAAYDIQDTWPHVLVVPAVLDTVSRNAGANDIIARIAPDHLYQFNTNDPMPNWISQPAADDPDPNAAGAASIYSSGAFNNGRQLTGMVTVLDAWDQPLRLVHPGPVAAAGVASNADGTVYVDYGAEHEMRYGTAVSRQICFISAGPDGKFGDLSSSTPEVVGQTMDNIYSYELIKP
jgi:type II secretory pathway pseudopilin PulG